MPNPELFHFIKHLTTAPGVYRMLDEVGCVIYVGKASNLKKRVSSYFNKSHTAHKTQQLVSKIHSIEVTITRSEKEALLLESSLIKNLRPKYNVLMRDDKSYPYLRLSLEHGFSSLMMVRCKVKPEDKSYFGPYPNVSAVKETLNLIQKIFKIRNCTDTFFNGRSRPCLQYQLKRCSAPCTRYISPEEYKVAVQDTVLFLQGKSQDIIQSFENRMSEAVKALRFEEASLIRDQIKQLRYIQEQQSVILRQGCVDVIIIDTSSERACIQWLSVRKGQVLDSQTFFPQMPTEIDPETIWQEIFEAFVLHFYQDKSSQIPEKILTDHPIQEPVALEELLSEWRQSRCTIQTQVRGTKARWIDFARNHLNHVISTQRISQQVMEDRYLALQQFLQMQAPIRRMVCFDISHTQGNETVASCVVFDRKGPKKNAYRRFNIKNITPGDDYAAMEQVVYRYFSRLTVEEMPELVIIDGGKGQVSLAQKVMISLSLSYVQILGIAKGPARKAGAERLIISNEQNEEILPETSIVRHLLQYIRDEAHRFAITAHRKKRQKSGMSSSLTEIPGIGAKRRQALLQRFGGLQGLTKASVEEILKVKGISQKLALEIYQHFHR